MSQRDRDQATAEAVFQEIWRGVPGPLLVDPLKLKTRFLGGIWTRYYQSIHGRRYWSFCWSTNRNENGKFISYIETPAGGWRRVVEHRRRKAAKARAWRLMVQFDAKGKK